MKSKKYFGILLAGFLSLRSYAQTADTTNRFNDDLLDHLVGTWNVASVAHGFSSSATVTADWAFNHQIFHLHFTGNDSIPWIGSPMVFDYFIGYNHNQKRYVVHAMSVFGYDNGEGFWYGSRNGNELKLIQTEVASTSDTFNIQRLIWKPETKSWLVQSRPDINGKEQDVFLDMKFTRSKISN